MKEPRRLGTLRSLLLLRGGLRAALAVSAAVASVSSAAEPPAGWTELVWAMESTWRSRDADAFAALGGPDLSPTKRLVERAFAAERFLARDSVLTVRVPPGVPSHAARVDVDATAFLASELSARVEQWRFELQRRPSGWIVTDRTEQGAIDGLIQLPMDPTPRRAEGVVLRLEDFELRMRSGHVFTTPESLGTVAFVFVGDAEVEVTPRPQSERERLRRFCGKEVLRDRVKAAFVRVRPEELGRVLSTTDLQGDASGAARRPEAERFWRAEASRVFLLDTPDLPRSPWWISPSPGGALVAMATARHGLLTFTVSPSEAEDLNLFDRRKKLQLLMYSSGGREPRFDEDDRRSFDLEHIDLAASFDPVSSGIRGRARLRFRSLQGSSTLRLRLAESLEIASVSLGEESFAVAARVRGQSSVVVLLPPAVARKESFEVLVRYSGRLDPMDVEDEAQIAPTRFIDNLEDEIPVSRVLVYSSRLAWYPKNTTDDFATSRVVLDVPKRENVISGGELLSEREEGGRRVVEYRHERPAKYLAAIVGRFGEAGTRQAGPVKLRAFATPLMKSTASRALDDLGPMIDFFSREFGPCPYAHVNLVVFEGRTPGGHSPAGLLLLQERTPLFRKSLAPDPANFSDVSGFILAHEAAHQWWGQGVSGENYRERWLVEGAAQYAAARFIREREGAPAHAALLRRFHKWALEYNDHGPLHLGQRLGQIENDARIYRGVVYDKGAAVFESLRALVGEDPWRVAIRSYQEAHRFSKAGSADFREALEAASGMNLAPYFAAWVYGTRLPTLSVRHRVASRSAGPEVTIEAVSNDLPGEVPLRLRFVERAGSREVDVRLRPGHNTWTFELGSPLRRIEPNADRAMLFR